MSITVDYQPDIYPMYVNGEHFALMNDNDLLRCIREKLGRDAADYVTARFALKDRRESIDNALDLLAEGLNELSEAVESLESAQREIRSVITT